MCDVTSVVPGKVRFLSHAWEGLQGYVAQVAGGTPAGPPRCVAAFRGTTRLMNWVADIKFTTWNWPRTFNAPCEGCQVHLGFLQSFERLRGQMFEAIKDLQCASIRFTGHSFGGAVATLASFEARATPGLAVEATYTYGSPRVGNGAFVRAYVDSARKDGVEPAMWRIVHYRDPAARVPPVGWPLDYGHMPTEVYYDRGFARHHVCQHEPDLAENTSCAFATPFFMCVNLDHVTYLNRTTLGHRLPRECGVREATL